jgi:hypothetical protein
MFYRLVVHGRYPKGVNPKEIKTTLSGGAYGFNLKTCVDGLQFGGDPGENELAPQNAFRFFTGLVDRENALKFAQR